MVIRPNAKLIRLQNLSVGAELGERPGRATVAECARLRLMRLLERGRVVPATGLFAVGAGYALGEDADRGLQDGVRHVKELRRRSEWPLDIDEAGHVDAQLPILTFDPQTDLTGFIGPDNLIRISHQCRWLAARGN